MLERVSSLLKMAPPVSGDRGLLFASGATVPTDGTDGYQPGCIFQHTDGSTGTALYVNEGSVTSCDFNAVAAMTAAQEALLGATAGTATASKAVILDANKAIDAVRTAALYVGTSGSEAAVILDDMTPGTGISTGTGTICEHRVTKVGGLYKTEILLDITGLNEGGTAADIIGKDGGTANCHIGQITAAKNGTIIAGRITCLEAPGTADTDIDFYGSVDEATGAQDAALSSVTGEEQLIDHGAWSAGEIAVLTALPDADGYLYLTTGAGTTLADDDYTAGIFLIELWGK